MGMVITLSLLWGGSFFFTGVAVKELPTFTVVVARFGLAAMILLIVTRIMGVKLPSSRSVWLAFFGRGYSTT